MIPLWIEIVAASLTSAFALYKTIGSACRKHAAAQNVWRLHCHAGSDGASFFAVNGRWDRTIPLNKCGECHTYYNTPRGGCQKVRGAVDPTDDDAMASARVETEDRAAILNAQKANYR